MASVILSAAGSAAGSVLLGPAVGAGMGAAIGRMVGSYAGSMLDGALFGGQEVNVTRGARLSDLTVQTSTYGEAIPLVYGSIRLAGNVIWSRPIREQVVKSTQQQGGKGGGGGGATVTTTSYRYSVTLAVALCEGPIDGVLRGWADAKPLNFASGTYRVYKGTESQLPDPLIEAVEGIGKTPAYRGLAYVVIEDFPLADYGNRIPNFTFEVKRSRLPDEAAGQAIESMITGVTLIPGSGEFVYDTTVQQKLAGYWFNGRFYRNEPAREINRHSHTGEADVQLALDQLQETLPNLEWVSVVCGWFGTSMDAGACQLVPGVEFKDVATTAPEIWSVAGYDRDEARQITSGPGGGIQYGGTPDDQSILRLLTELRARGLKILFYPLFFMDVADKPWRGRVTGTATEVANFFTKTNGYNAFIIHYAQLVEDKVDAFCIGSELVGLTTVSSAPGAYPAVSALVSLAATVRGILGPDVTLTYAANWDEYHHAPGGWYHLDPLWASEAIDVVGIDAYFQLTDAPEEQLTLAQTIAGWNSGECYDYYYTDEARSVTAPLQPDYALKNIDWWWNHRHRNPDDALTDWLPQMKPIWFTEYGFPSVDGATNQPNVFYDPTSSKSFFPRYSRGQVSFAAQRRGIAATETVWKDSPMVTQRFCWTWDARPYPYYPALTDVWADGHLWPTGHWLNGKLGAAGLSGVVRDLCVRAGLTDGQLELGALSGVLEGIAFNKRMRYLDALEMLQQAFAFDLVDSGSALKACMRGQGEVTVIGEDELIEPGGQKPVFSLQRQQAVELPKQIEVGFFDPGRDYELGTERASREGVSVTREVGSHYLPLVMRPVQARQIAERLLYTQWMERAAYHFTLPRRYAALEPGDVLQLGSHRLRLTRTRLAAPGVLEVQGLAEDAGAFIPSAAQEVGANPPPVPPQLPESAIQLLDLPALPGENLQQPRLLLAAAGLGEHWRGAVLYRSDDGGASWLQVASLPVAATMGEVATELPAFASSRWDEAHRLEVVLYSGELASAPSELAVLNGANLALVGDELVQFQHVEQLAGGHYRLSRLLRGRLGTEAAAFTHAEGERFVLLDSLSLIALPMDAAQIGANRLYQCVSVGGTLGGGEAFSYRFRANNLQPLSPVQLRPERLANDDLAIQWLRRTRGGGFWQDGADIPLQEERERYRVEIRSAGVVKRQWEVAAPTALYTAAQQTADFGSAPATGFELRVMQLSATVGAGQAVVVNV